MMVSIREATESAIAFARASLGEARTQNIRLEEVESAVVSDEDAWLITLSMTGSDPHDAVVESVLRPKREYKSFTVLKLSGEVKSMKIRALADA